MNLTWFNNTGSVISFVIQGVILLSLAAALIYTFFKVSKRQGATILFCVFVGLLVVSFVLEFFYAFMGLLFVILLMIFFLLMSNIGDVRKFLANPFVKSEVSKVKTVQKITDKATLFKEVEKAVANLSSKKIGALITFEKNTSLNDVCKNGVGVHAPFTSELVDTIFYPGTRLHDGAVIVKEGNIHTASVFFTPTTKPFAIKYGSRHRAALGISEISDAVTIVVSEETGLVSIAYEGNIEHVETEGLANTLANYF